MEPVTDLDERIHSTRVEGGSEPRAHQPSPHYPDFLSDRAVETLGRC